MYVLYMVLVQRAASIIPERTFRSGATTGRNSFRNDSYQNEILMSIIYEISTVAGPNVFFGGGEPTWPSET